MSGTCGSYEDNLGFSSSVWTQRLEHWRVCSVSIGCSSCGILGLAGVLQLLCTQVLCHGVFMQGEMFCVLAASFAMEIIMHGSILYKGHRTSVTSRFMCCFTLATEAPTHHVLLKKKKKSLISTRIVMAERQGQFCYRPASRDSERALGTNRDSAESRFVWPAKIKTQKGCNWLL